ncbi:MULTISPECIES: SMI1/KNR4 family protein [unclassified Streptomyces]|uniref:SMI1/KNR4 family protein n=1 Tax=unclassified Streptomyces TaxID=2593676 RepID=UPI000DC7E3D9|nr:MULTISPECIES: SMI1/KNR4 family protein [unclassified Streptomyces]AWZ05932.1 SMI1/KNR4 family protein [Streptomyces sp. ICC4]AWZ12965.1 SMI1/KNR4 family protein [Streptomyces sp. ICC1]
MWDIDALRERLRTRAEADPECRDFGARRHRWMLGPPVAEDVVAKFEQRHGFEFPGAYRSFITTVGSGGAGPAYGLYEFGSKPWVDSQGDLGANWADLLSVPFPHTGPFLPSDERSVCAEHSPGEEDFSPCWFTGSLIIAEIGCGSFYRLVVTGPGRGQVWTDDIGCGHPLSPGPDFHDWYMQWLAGSQLTTP